jgi:hypothetical protein
VQVETQPPAADALAESRHAVWVAELESALGCPIEIRWTRARSGVMRMRRSGSWSRGPRIELALAHFFRAAPPEIRAATAAWLRSGRRAKQACRSLDEWIETRVAELPARVPRVERLRSQGAVHDLAAIARALHEQGHLAEWLEPERTPPLAWGRAAGSRARRSLRLGSCTSRGDLIRIHPVLDQPAVPHYFVRAVVFHELLHVAFPSERDADGRRIHHGPAFRRAERAFVDFERARQWERAEIEALIRSARSGRPLAAPKNSPAGGAAASSAAARRIGPVSSASGVSAGAPGADARPGLLRIVQGLLFGT